MYQQLLPGVYAGVVSATTRDRAAGNWFALAAGLGLAPEASALGVLTELHNLRAAVARL